jgi:hypothetical protein
MNVNDFIDDVADDGGHGSPDSYDMDSALADEEEMANELCEFESGDHYSSHAEADQERQRAAERKLRLETTKRYGGGGDHDSSEEDDEEEDDSDQEAPSRKKHKGNGKEERADDIREQQASQGSYIHTQTHTQTHAHTRTRTHAHHTHTHTHR